MVDLKNTANYRWLLFSILILLALTPFRTLHIKWIDLLFTLLNSFIFITPLFASKSRGKLYGLLVCFTIPALVTLWAGYTAIYENEIIMLFSSAMFYLLVIMVIGMDIFKLKYGGSSHILAGSLCIYLLSGLAFACFYTIFQIYDPNAFHLPDVQTISGIEVLPGDPQSKYLLPTFFYHSFVTLSTLGYGDIHPQTFPARYLCVFQAIIGQIYLVVVVAGIVGINAGKFFNTTHKNNES
ncbi:MAG: potassium channel family protein [Lentisphaeraceae bacterium]|nr:potassium channel family protein [Lentisphaeraceae bacterium]